MVAGYREPGVEWDSVYRKGEGVARTWKIYMRYGQSQTTKETMTGIGKYICKLHNPKSQSLEE